MRKLSYLFLLVLFACEGEPELCTEYHSNGEVAFEVKCDQDGVYEGEMRMFHEDGSLRAIRHFSNGKERDTARYFYGAGGLYRVVPMTNDFPHGRTQWYRKDGTLKREADYVMGELHGQELKYYPDGKQIAESFSYQNGQIYGPYAQYTAEGIPVREGVYFGNIRFDQWKFFRNNGEISHVIGYYYNKKEGPFAIYRPSGLPYVTGNFREGLLEGKVNYYDREGSIVYQDEWIKGENVNYRADGGMPRTFDSGDVFFKVGKQKVYLTGDEVKIE